MVELWLLLGVAAATPREDLNAGDAAWFAQDRRAARDAWRAAAAGDDPAAQASAHLRLILVTGSVGMMVHGPRADRALARCPDADPWCDLARAERELIAAELGLPADRGLAAAWARAAEADLPGPAIARAVWAGAPAARLADLPRDALGEGLLASGGVWPDGPGTWALGLGVVGAPGLGVGGAARLVHPDLGFQGHYLEASAMATTRGLFSASAVTRTAGRAGAWATGQAARAVLDSYGADGARTDTEVVGLVDLRVGPRLSADRWALSLGSVFRYDGLPQGAAGHGAAAGARWDGRQAGLGPSLRLGAEAAWVDYGLLRATVDGRWALDAPGGTVAIRLLGDALPLGDDGVPVARLPSAGGETVMRGAPAGRWRGPGLGAVAVEYRHPFGEVLSGAIFAEGAWLPLSDDPGPHPGGGAGLRLSMPPRPYNTVRIDLGVTSGGWGLAVGYGEAF